MAHTCRGTINLSTAHIDTEDSCNIVLSSGGRTYHLKASSEVERQRWVTALELAKAKAIRMRNNQSDMGELHASIPAGSDGYSLATSLATYMRNLRVPSAAHFCSSLQTHLIMMASLACFPVKLQHRRIVCLCFAAVLRCNLCAVGEHSSLPHWSVASQRVYPGTVDMDI
ncbi:PREDICTED: oxysterol-binding protein 2-like [Crocodylus porosus]|uniref:oxysterol-binding protein 2-like n=1 Tax=Crocodylus porosus TaxID=8502 RepID=UPI00093B1C9D|nr:PREDICTED: oxysterol-binding protein 2-like [Crocodylus porosus]